MPVAVPDVVPLADLDTAKLVCAGKANFKQISYQFSDGDKPLFLRIPRSTVVDLDVFQDDKGHKLYLVLDVTPHQALFDTLQKWVDTACPEGRSPHPILRQADGKTTLKVKLPLVDNLFDGGVFDDEGQPVELTAVTPGAGAQLILHVASLWNFRDAVGVTLNTVQIMVHPKASECLIADEDTPYAPYHLQIV